MQSDQPKLSICIATFNRSRFLAQTLERLAEQVTDDCEIVISDNASSDDTEHVASTYVGVFKHLRYERQAANVGPDRNFDSAVGLATGEYCWLMPDDDLLKPGAVAAVLGAMNPDVSLIVVNVEFRDRLMARVVQRGALSGESSKIYEPGQLDRLFLEVGTLLGYIGSVIIRRAIWLERNRERYFGTGHVYLGVIYQEQLPGRTVVIAEPLIDVRLGNRQEWWPATFDIYMNSPSFISSLALSDAIKRSACEVETWKRPGLLLWLRALGVYSSTQYLEWVRPRLRSRLDALLPFVVALVPSSLVNGAFSFYYQVTRRSRYGYSHEWVLHVLQQARCHRRQDH